MVKELLEDEGQITENKEMKKDNDSSSETSSYKSDKKGRDENILMGKMMIDGKEMELESASSSEDEDSDSPVIDLDDEEGPVPTSYVKTAHEIEPEEIEKVGPQISQIQLDDIDEINAFG